MLERNLWWTHHHTRTGSDVVLGAAAVSSSMFKHPSKPYYDFMVQNALIAALRERILYISTEVRSIRMETFYLPLVPLFAIFIEVRHFSTQHTHTHTR